MVPELDPIWRFAYWLVLVIAIGVPTFLTVVIVLDYLRERRAPEPRRSAIRSGLRSLPKHPPPQ